MAANISQYDKLAVKKQSALDVYSEPLSADYDVIFFDIGKPAIDWGITSLGKPANGKQDTGESVIGKQSISQTGTFPLKFTSTPDTPGNLEKIMEGSGLSSNVDVSNHYFEYAGKPACVGMSMKFQGNNCAPTYSDMIGKGAVFNLSIAAEAVGAQIQGTIEIMGANNGYARSTTTLGDPVAGTPEASDAFLASTLTLDGDTYTAKAFALSMQATMTDRPDSSEAKGIVNYFFNGMDPIFRVVVEDEDYALHAKFLAGTIFSTNTKLELPNFDIEILKAKIRDIQKIDSDGIECSEVIYEVKHFKIIRQ